METETLSVRLSGLPIGILSRTKEGEMRFVYLDSTKSPISLSMPINNFAYGNLACESYFGGLLPESEDVKKAIGREYKINPNSTFDLLRAIGHDCAGAISFHDVSSPIEADDYHDMKVKKISAKQLEKHIIELPQKPLFVGVPDLRLSLAGVQEKAAVCVIDNDIYFALHGTPTTHILKPAIKNYPATVQNEYLCMKTANQLGLSAARVEIRQAKSQVYLLVERYDRRTDKTNRIRRLHQEDFCQALGNREKYERYYGPSVRDCFELTYDFAVPVLARNSLMDIIVFNYIIGNTDAHGKNFALLYDEQRKVHLAPFYDLLCNQVYKKLTNDMSMKIGNNFEHDTITTADWEILCNSVGFSYPALKKIISKQTELLPKIVLEQRKQLKDSEFDSPLLDKIVQQVNRNCKKLSRL